MLTNDIVKCYCYIIYQNIHLESCLRIILSQFKSMIHHSFFILHVDSFLAFCVRMCDNVITLETNWNDALNLIKKKIETFTFHVG